MNTMDMSKYEAALYERLTSLLGLTSSQHAQLLDLDKQNGTLADAFQRSQQRVASLHTELEQQHANTVEIRNTNVALQRSVEQAERARDVAERQEVILREMFAAIPTFTLDDDVIKRAVFLFEQARTCYGPGGGVDMDTAMRAAIGGVLPRPTSDRIIVRNEGPLAKALGDLLSYIHGGMINKVTPEGVLDNPIGRAQEAYTAYKAGQS